ncbi:MAG: MarR family winged helix-turn-helix transcriptional regulator [Candidatus Bathyarchaeia archaeon]
MISKKDYRLRTSPSERKVKAQNMIRETLMKGEKRFTDLLLETGLSRPALSYNLRELEEKSEVESRIDSNDLRVKFYSLTEKGINAYKRQKDIENLSSFRYFPFSIGEFIQALGTLFRDLMEVYGDAVHYAYSDYKVPPIKKESQDIIKKCVTFSFYFEEDLKGENPYQVFRQTLKEFAQVAVLAASSHDVNIERLKRLPNLFFVFKLDKERLINECQGRTKGS